MAFGDWTTPVNAPEMARPARRKISTTRCVVEHASDEATGADVVDVTPMAGYAPKVEVVNERVRVTMYPVEAFGG
jgi:hypothetical protein